MGFCQLKEKKLHFPIPEFGENGSFQFFLSMCYKVLTLKCASLILCNTKNS